MSKRVLVSGCTGFTGRYMVKNLMEHGYDVYGFSSGGRKTSNRYYSVNMLDAAAVEECVKRIQPDYVVHLAGVAFVADCDSTKIYRTNLEGTYNILNALKKFNMGRQGTVLASSANVYGNIGSEVLSETDATLPVSHYGVSKLAMEMMSKIFSTDLPIVIARPFNYTGIGQSEHFLIPKIIKHFKEKRSQIILGNTHVAREFGDVRQIVDLYRMLLEKPIKSGETYNISTGQPIKITQVIKLCEQLTGHRIEVLRDEKFIRTNEILSLSGNNQKLVSHIGAGFNPTSIRDLISWMLS